MDPIKPITNITSAIYLAIAFVLTLLAVISFYDVGIQVLLIPSAANITTGILQVLHALLITIIIIELLETVLAYFRTYQLQVRPIIIAGLTAIIRRVLLFGYETTDPLDMAITLAAIAVLTFASVYVVKKEGVE